jgi:hypothetical protein
VNRQRTLLPYRLERDAAVQAIRDEIDWMDCVEVARLLERLTQTADWEAGHNLYVVLRELMHRDLAHALVVDLWRTSRAVWLFEREWKFENGIALVPVVRVATVNLTPFQRFILPLLGGVA